MTNNEIFKGIDVLTKLLTLYKDIKPRIIYDKSVFKTKKEEQDFCKNVIENSEVIGYPCGGKGIQNFVAEHNTAIPTAAERKILDLISKIKTD